MDIYVFAMIHAYAIIAMMRKLKNKKILTLSFIVSMLSFDFEKSSHNIIYYNTML